MATRETSKQAARRRTKTKRAGDEAARSRRARAPEMVAAAPEAEHVRAPGGRRAYGPTSLVALDVLLWAAATPSARQAAAATPSAGAANAWAETIPAPAALESDVPPSWSSGAESDASRWSSGAESDVPPSWPAGLDAAPVLAALKAPRAVAPETLGLPAVAPEANETPATSTHATADFGPETPAARPSEAPATPPAAATADAAAGADRARVAPSPTSATAPSPAERHRSIAARAFAIAEAFGFRIAPFDAWLRAEREVDARRPFVGS